MVIAILVSVVLLLLAIGLWVLSRRTRQAIGLPPGQVIYADTGGWQRNERAYFSSTHRIAGKPDYLVRDGKTIVPVELKSGVAPVVPRTGHVLQLAAYCLLVEENLSVKPAYGIIQYADKQFAVEYTPALRAELLQVVEEMRAAVDSPDGAHRNHNDARRCAGCGVRAACDERLGISDKA